LLVAGLLGLAPAAPAPAQASAATLPVPAAGSAEWRQELAAWRAQRERDLAAPDGWLTLVGLEWLKPGVNSVGAAADNQIKLSPSGPDQPPAHLGLLTVSGLPTAGPSKAVQTKTGRSKAVQQKTGQSKASPIIQLLAPSGGFPPELKIDGQQAREGPLIVEGEKPSTITWRGLTMVVLERGGRYALRIKDANSPTRTGFKGLNWYSPDPGYLIKAQWIPYTPAHVEKIPTIIGTTLDLPAPGIAEFTLGGKTLRLEPVLEDPADKSLFFILRDETRKTTTYQAARFLDTGFPDHGLGQPGVLVLDFNRLVNPPCAYTPYATCPLPPEQNRLPVAIEAGEQRYSH
jgi:uncharacterized protein (DUF1684 family)